MDFLSSLGLHLVDFIVPVLTAGFVSALVVGVVLGLKDGESDVDTFLFPVEPKDYTENDHVNKKDY